MAAPAWNFCLPLFNSLYRVQHPCLFPWLPPALPSPALPSRCPAPSLLPCCWCSPSLCPALLREVGHWTLSSGIGCQAWVGAVQILIHTLRNNAMWSVWGEHSVMWGCSFVTLNSFITSLFQLQIQPGRECSLKCTERRRGSQNKCHSSGY